MNCKDFQELLFEHLDGTLPPEEQGDLRQHLSLCEECREQWTKQRLLGEHLTARFAQETDELMLSRAARARILQACERPTLWEHVAAVWREVSWGWGLAALVLCGIALFGSRGLKPGAVPLARGPELPVMVSLRLPQVMACYSFRKEGGLVVDTLVYRTNVVQESLWSSHKPHAE